jgi:holo-ACP synthase CitX
MHQESRDDLLAPLSPAPSLKAVLTNREERAGRQRAMRERRPGTLVSFCVNMPGPVKDSRASRIAYDTGMGALKTAFAEAGFAIAEWFETRAATGRECVLAVSGDARAVKKTLIALEESHPLGRLFDFDVLDGTGATISRTELGYVPRACLVCGEPAASCARARAHGLDTVLERVSAVVANFQRSARTL